jgi:hypothetical protein
MPLSAAFRTVLGLLITVSILESALAQPIDAQATTLTFGPVPTMAGGTAIPNPYVTQGYTFGCINADDATACSSLEVPGTGLGVRFTGAATLFNNNIFGITTIAQANGSPFDLFSARISPFNVLQTPLPLVFEGFLASGGTVTQSFAYTTSPGTLATYTFGPQFVNLLSVQYRVGGFGAGPVSDAAQVNDFVVSPATTTPEPGSITLIVSGLIAIAPFARRRRVR